ncbi:hypothetical protein ACBY01_06510 [Sphingomonas sp. ac-8]|uniref:hypothetical protein n=1 Tax=Sphingomonas sp. ac-8 TaxID=3242977 RepID=UPI003A80833D
MIAVLLAAAALAQAAPAAPTTGPKRTLGIFERWGAFADMSPRRCYAIAKPISRRTALYPFASVASWPGAHVRNQLHLRLSRKRSPSAKVTLSIGDRRFPLRAGDLDAWAPDADADRAIVTAMRSARSMSVESVTAGGRPFADVYALSGAATAIDAAALACLRG